MNDMNDPLNYTEDELKALSTEDLELLIKTAKAKEALFDTEQLALKIMMNALYGAMANKYFPLFNEQMAAAITGNGRYFIQKLAKYIEKTLQGLHKSEKQYLIYSDTDSVYFHIEPFMNMYIAKNPNLVIDNYVDWADNFEKKVIQPTIERTIADFAEELNAYNAEKIGAEREIIADAAVFTAKKKYYARVRDSEGTRFPADMPKIKVMGLEIAKSSTPVWAKDKLKAAIPHILDKDENDLRNWVKNIKQEFLSADLNDISQSGSVSNLGYKLSDKGIPIGSRAALVYNKYINDTNLLNTYNPIQPGDKCKRLFLLEPNKFNSNIIAFTNDNFVKEIGDCIDYDTNFQKGFMQPLNLMVNAMNYNLEKETVNLDDW